MDIKNICLLNDSFPPFIDGVVNTVINYAEQFMAEGKSPFIVTPDHPDADDSGFSYPVIRYKSFDIRKKTGYMMGVPFSPETARQVKPNDIHILHSHCPMVSTLLGRQLRQITDAPLIQTYHTRFDIDIANVIKNKVILNGSIKMMVENISACDEVWTVSRGAADNLRSLGFAGECVVMPNGVDMPKGRVSAEAVLAATAEYDLPAGVPVYLFVGRMRWYKGLKIILDALAKLHSDNKDFRMVFIGEGLDLDDVMEYSKKCGVFEKCVFPGPIRDREVLRAWYCRSDLFLFPSTYDTNGLVVREAAACSLASILIKGSCAAEDATDGRNGFIIEENADSLYDCLKRLYGNFDKMRTVGEGAANDLYTSWETAVKMALDRYDIVYEKYKSGDYASRRKPMEYFLKANGEIMENLGHLLNARDQILQYIKSKFER